MTLIISLPLVKGMGSLRKTEPVWRKEFLCFFYHWMVLLSGVRGGERMKKGGFLKCFI